MRRSSGMGALAARRRVLGRCVLGAATVVLAMATQFAASTPRALAAGCAGSSVYTVAHEDDSILFQDPDLPREIAAGRCVRTIFLTAGDAGSTNSSYWLGREAGARAAYAELMNGPNTWTQTDAGVAGHPIPLFVSTAQPRVSLAFMRLPDGNLDGSGYATTGYHTLQKLWTGSVGSLTTVDGTSTYTRSDLITALETLIQTAAPDRVLTQDFVGTYGDGDHSDHHTTAYFTHSASRQYATAHVLVGYQDYGISSRPVNLSATDSQAKQATFLTYAPYDPNACQTVAACQTNGYAAWWQREYTLDTEFSDLAPASGQAGTTVTLTGSGFTGASGVSFNGVPAAFTVSSDTSIAATVPAGAVTGFVTVSTSQGPATSPRPFTVLGAAGSNTAGAATVTASSENASTAQLAVKAVDGFTDGYSTGDYTHEWATVGQKAGAWLNLQWSSPQKLGSITLYDRPDLTDQITGGTISFSDGSTLTVPTLPNNGAPLTLTFPTKTVTSLRLTVTAVGASTGNIGLAELQAFTATTGTAPVPHLTSFAPSSGPTGSTVTLTGSGFTGATAVKLNGSTATYTVNSDTQAQLVVPAAATSGTISITTRGGTATSTSNFTVTSPAATNVAPAATVTASSENASTGQFAVKAVDGFTDGYSTGDYTHEWATVGQKAGAWLNLQWSSPQTLGSITLYDRPNANDQITGGTITFSDGSTVTVPALPNNGSAFTLTFPTKTVTSLRLTVTVTSSTTLNIGLAEIRAFTA